jgi:hypothetical protein
MAKLQNDRRGEPVYDMRVKANKELIDWTVKNFGYDRDTGTERTMNSTIVTALRTLRDIKS